MIILCNVLYKRFSVCFNKPPFALDFMVYRNWILSLILMVDVCVNKKTLDFMDIMKENNRKKA